eukprot:TRINITY_DN5768_c0_g1_i1.p1 TRINITY_DN5768_c0_g1~~TRINITY_DN5768_c0_g1_i1.p1  ORF type:complete len:344 (-),score=75.26 TRINITY_DN5768_c0_g1_i1:32-1042(-)
MKTTIIFLLLLIVAALANHSDEQKWKEFKKKYAKSYDTVEEEAKRFAMFQRKLARIEAHNSDERHSYKIGINHMSDLSVEEYREKYLGFRAKEENVKIPTDQDNSVGALPLNVDWTQKNAVTYVKNQGQCGSCWTFSTTGSIEGFHAIHYGVLVSLSEQNILDCTWGPLYNDTGCNGGDTRSAFQYVVNNKGIDTEASYPYQDVNGGDQEACQYSWWGFGASISAFAGVIQGNETDLQRATVLTPVSVAIDASSESFQDYQSGIYVDDQCGNTIADLDHGVLVTGYGTDSDWFGSTYWWNVKNSWGEDWGNAGYMQFSRNNNNMCGIATYATYATK